MIHQNRAMIITPLDASAYWVRQTVTNALFQLGMQVLELDQMTTASNIPNVIASAIESADLIVVDVSRQNPSVMYELGYAHALRKPTILLLSRESTEALPADLAGHLYVVYDPGNSQMLADRLVQLVRQYITRT